MKLYYHKTDGGAEYLCSSKVEGSENEGSLMSEYIIRIDGDITRDAELFSSHVCRLPKCIQEALNSGDGVYRP